MPVCLSGALRLLVAASVCVVSVSASAAEKKNIVTVTPNEARLIRLPKMTQTLIIGNPLVADVTLLKNNASMVITGKSFGLTNMIALDSQGNKVDETYIEVAEKDASFIVYRGMNKESYSCAPVCAPTVALGDNPKYMQEVIAASAARNGASVNGGAK